MNRRHDGVNDSLHQWNAWGLVAEEGEGKEMMMRADSRATAGVLGRAKEGLS